MKYRQLILYLVFAMILSMIPASATSAADSTDNAGTGRSWILDEVILSDLPAQPMQTRDSFGTHSATITLTDTGIIYEIITLGTGEAIVGKCTASVKIDTMPSVVYASQGKIEARINWSITATGKPRYTIFHFQMDKNGSSRKIININLDENPTGTVMWDSLLLGEGRFEVNARLFVAGDPRIKWVYLPGNAPLENQQNRQEEVEEEIPQEEPEEETPRERMERVIMQNLLDYIEMYRKFEEEMKPLYSRADAIMEDLRDARWLLVHGTDDDKGRAREDIADLQDDMKDLLKETNKKAGKLEEILDDIEEEFVDYEQKQELKETLRGFQSQLNLNRINLVLRSGNTEDFDLLFQEYRADPNIADQVLVGNAFRKLMDGNIRTALESAKLALAKNGENPTAQQLLRDLEMHYLDVIRDKLAAEQSQNARLFNEKLNGHGEQGVGGFLLDVLTTGAGESMQSLAAYLEIYQKNGIIGLTQAGFQAVAEGKHPQGYYDFLQEISSLNIDEATAQIAGIQFVKTLRQNGITLSEMSSMTIPGLQDIVMKKFDGRVLSEQEAEVLRKRIWDAFKNPDVDALRKGEKTQLDVDTGKDYFDTEILEQGTSDIIMRQFSAWDTFLTFAPSAQLGNISKLGIAQRLGLKAEATLQQGLQKGLMIEELGKSLYQTRVGAAVIDATYQWNGFTEMISQAVKKRIGDVAYSLGPMAIQAVINDWTAPEREALAEELQRISDYYLGAETTANVQATVDTMGSFFGFIGANREALLRGAYGVEDLEKAKDQIEDELKRRQAMANNVGVAEVSRRPVDFADFESRVARGGETYVKGLSDARDRIRGAADSPIDRRGMIAAQGEEALEQMEEAARALQHGDRAGAEQIFTRMQSGAGRNFDFAHQESLRKLGGATDMMRLITALESSSPTDRDFAIEAVKHLMSSTSETSSGEALTDILITTGFRVIPE